MRHMSLRRPANLKRTMPQWSRNPQPEGVQYRVLLPAGPHVANVVHLSFEAGCSRKHIADALRSARNLHAGWDKRPRPVRAPQSLSLDSMPPAAAPIAPVEMVPAHDVAPAAAGQMFLF